MDETDKNAPVTPNYHVFLFIFTFFNTKIASLISANVPFSSNLVVLVTNQQYVKILEAEYEALIVKLKCINQSFILKFGNDICGM